MTMAGADVASSVTKYGVLLGTLLPGIFIIILGGVWIVPGVILFSFLSRAPQLLLLKNLWIKLRMYGSFHILQGWAVWRS